MRNFLRWSLAAILTITLATSISAQETKKRQPPRQGQGGGAGGGGFGRGMGMGGGGGFSALMIASNADAQKDLGINEEAAEKIKALSQEIQDARREMMAGGFPMEEEARTKMMEQMTKLNADGNAKLAKILDKKQNERVEQIQIQASGNLGALNMANVSKALGLSDDQKKQVTEANEEMGAKRRELFQAGGNNQEAMAEIRKASDEAAMKILDDKQKKTLATLKGKTFDVSKLMQFGGGGRGGPGGGAPGKGAGGGAAGKGTGKAAGGRPRQID